MYTAAYRGMFGGVIRAFLNRADAESWADRVGVAHKATISEVTFARAEESRLVASAPDLLAALEYIVAWSPDAEKWNAETARDKAAAAIAKAKGK